MDSDWRTNALATYPSRAGGEARPYHVTSVTTPSEKHWGTSEITVFRGDERVGAYKRNYFNFNESTFEPFELNGKWYALYSPDYTSTRLMSLPGCGDIGGETPDDGGFCPVEFYVPRYRHITGRWKKLNKLFSRYAFESDAERSLSVEDGETAAPWQCLDIAFVAGCHWGDDSSWKLQVFDLSKAATGEITRSERFGSVELARRLPLVGAVQIYKHDDIPPGLTVTVIAQRTYNLTTGEFIHPYD